MARGRKPIGKKAMTGAQRQRRYREKRAYETGALKAEINRLTRLKIKHYRLAKMERDLAFSIEVAQEAWADEPERLRARLAQLRRMAAEFRRRPATYYSEALFQSCKPTIRQWLALGRRPIQARQDRL
jgi:hypothetical protein